MSDPAGQALSPADQATPSVHVRAVDDLAVYDPAPADPALEDLAQTLHQLPS